MVWKISLPSPFRRSDNNNANRDGEGAPGKLATRLFRRSRRSLNPIQIDVEYREDKSTADANEILHVEDGIEPQSPSTLSSCGWQSQSGSIDFNDQDSGVILNSCGDCGQSSDKGLYSDIFVEIPKTSAGVLDVVIGGGSDQSVKTPVVQRVLPSSQTARAKVVQIGDQIVSINGQSVDKLKLAKIQHLIKHSKSPVRLLLRRKINELPDGGKGFVSEMQILQKGFEEVFIAPAHLPVNLEETPPTLSQVGATECRRTSDHVHRPMSRNDPARHSLKSYHPVLSTFGQSTAPVSPNKDDMSTSKTPSCATTCDNSETLTIFRSRSYSAPMTRQASAVYQEDVLQLSPNPPAKASVVAGGSKVISTSTSSNSNRDSTADTVVHLIEDDDVSPWPAGRLSNSSQRRLFKSKSFSLKSPDGNHCRSMMRDRFVPRANTMDDASSGATGGKQVMHSRSAYDRLRSSFRKRRGKRAIASGQSIANTDMQSSVMLTSVSTSSLNTDKIKLIKAGEKQKLFKLTYDCMLDLGVSIGGGVLSTYGDCPPFVRNIRPGSLADRSSFNIGDTIVEINGKPTRKMTSSEVTALLRDSAMRKVYITIEPTAALVSPKSPRSL